MFRRWILVILLFSTCLFNTFALYDKILLSDLVIGICIVFFLPKIIISAKITKDVLWDTILVGPIMVLALCRYLITDDSVTLLSNSRAVYFIAFHIIFKLHLAREKEHLAFYYKAYMAFVVLNSGYIISQNVCFYALGKKFFIDFGDRTTLQNSVKWATTIIRSGGVFREPNWYILVSIPFLYHFFLQRKDYRFYLLILSIILTTSTAGYIIVAMYYFIEGITLSCRAFHGKTRSRLRKPKTREVLVLMMFVVGLIVVITRTSFIFQRQRFVFETGGSTERRILETLSELKNVDEYILLGKSYSAYQGGVSLAPHTYINSAGYFMLSFGLLGILLIFDIYVKDLPLLISLFNILMLFSASVYGRPDYWIVLAIVKVYYKHLKFEPGKGPASPDVRQRPANKSPHRVSVQPSKGVGFQERRKSSWWIPHELRGRSDAHSYS